MNTPVTLITSLYNDENSHRIEELIYCLENNISNPLINKICVVFDGWQEDNSIAYPLQELVQGNNKIDLEYCVGKPDFKELFDISNKRYKDNIIIIANSDIHYDNTIRLIHQINLTATFIVLSRYNKNDQGQWELIKLESGVPNYFSFDSFIYRSPVDIELKHNIKLGSMFCDSFLAHQLYSYTEYNVVNPCLEIKSYHIQKAPSLSQIHNKNEDKKDSHGKWRDAYVKNIFSTPISGCKWSKTEYNFNPASQRVSWKSQENIFLNIADIKHDVYIEEITKFAERYQKALWLYSKQLTKSELLHLTRHCNTNVNVINQIPEQSQPIKFSPNKSNKASLEDFFALHQDDSAEIDTRILSGIANITKANKEPEHAYITIGIIKIIETSTNKPTIDLIQNNSNGLLSLELKSNDKSTQKGIADSVDKYGLDLIYLIPEFCNPNYQLLESLLQKQIKLSKISLFKTAKITSSGNKFITDPQVGYLDILKHWSNNGIGFGFENMLIHNSIISKVQWSFNNNLRNKNSIDFLLKNLSYSRTVKINSIIGETEVQKVNVRKDYENYWHTDYYNSISEQSNNLGKAIKVKYDKLRDEAYMYLELFEI